mgnify:CR=1 FL=1
MKKLILSKENKQINNSIIENNKFIRNFSNCKLEIHLLIMILLLLTKITKLLKWIMLIKQEILLKEFKKIIK